jgi:hypothetical protein
MEGKWRRAQRDTRVKWSQWKEQDNGRVKDKREDFDSATHGE